MNDWAFPIASACGALGAAGCWAVLGSGRNPTPRLDDALALLDGSLPSSTPGIEIGAGEALGGWVYGRLRLPVSAEKEAQLRLRGTSVAGFYTEKAILALVGLCLPSLVASAFSLLLGISWGVPVIAGVAGMATGFFVPDLSIRRTAGHVRNDAGEALFLFFDLITLERLANQSATQALASAADISDHPLFVQLRGVLERARLEQRTPYGGLRELATRLDLPPLADVAEVMQLDEQGASLSGVLRARVRELRDSHLNDAVVAAQEISERMTLFMVLPALVFGLIFLVPPLLRLIN